MKSIGGRVKRRDKYFSYICGFMIVNKFTAHRDGIWGNKITMRGPVASLVWWVHPEQSGKGNYSDILRRKNTIDRAT